MDLKRTLAMLVTLAITGIAGPAEARDQIRIVGSSTVFPFATAVAENFGKSTSFKTPVVESTGSGGGLKLFCSGVGVETPDVTNASRKIKDSEIASCKANGVAEGGAEAVPMLKKLRGDDKKAFQAIAHAIREDGAYNEAGENDNLIVQKLEANPSGA